MIEIKNRFTGNIIKTVKQANLRGTDLRGADLQGANLRWADLRWVDLRWVDLRWVDFEFWQFPSIRLLSSINLGYLSDNLTIELMRRDAQAHPRPELFDIWANGGACPYRDDVERFWLFEVKKELWSPGIPQMADRDLIVEICKEKGWGIKRYLEIKKEVNNVD
jgi:hypothetical protein